MRVTILPQRKQVELQGRKRAGEVLRQLGFLPGTAMVIRGDELVPESQVLEADDVIEVRSVISGGVDARAETSSAPRKQRRSAPR